MTPILLAQDDAQIVRADKAHDAYAVLHNAEGDWVRAFPSSWTDDQIYHALAFANHAHKVGYARGAREKAAEIRAALGCAHINNEI